MALKPGAKDCVVKEQIIEDLVTGLTIQIKKYSDESGGCKISIHGECLRFGNWPSPRSPPEEFPLKFSCICILLAL